MPPRPPHAPPRAARARAGLESLACEESLPLSPPGPRRFTAGGENASTASPLSPLVPRDLSKLFESAAVDVASDTRAARAARRAAMSPLASPRGCDGEDGLQSATRGRGVKRTLVPPSTRTTRARGVPPPSTGGSRAPSQPRPFTWPPSAGGTTDVSDVCDAVPSGASGVLPSFGPPEPRKPAAPPPSALVLRAPAARGGVVARPRLRR